MKRNQSGFTLIEIAIVLVIIGLLLGGVLKGQELINSAKVKNLATDFRNVPVFIYGYQDKYKALPGDDLNLASHLGASATPCTTTGTVGQCMIGSGIIDGLWNANSATSESFVFWQHIRMAGFGPGSIIADLTLSPDYLPTNAVGGKIGVTNAAQAPIIGMKGTYIVCSDSIPGKFAKQLDITLDDGNTTTGSLMVTTAGTSGATPAAALPMTGVGAIVDDTPYLVCMGY